MITSERYAKLPFSKTARALLDASTRKLFITAKLFLYDKTSPYIIGVKLELRISTLKICFWLNIIDSSILPRASPPY